MSLLRRILATGGALLLVSVCGPPTPLAHAEGATEKPISGASESASAPIITAGEYGDKSQGSDSDKTALYYRVKRQWKNSTIRVNTVARMSKSDYSKYGDRGIWHFELSAGDEQCGSVGGDSIQDRKTGTLVSQTLLAPQLDPKKASPDPKEKACAEADELIYKVERLPGTGGERPFEIRVVEEPPADNADQLPDGISEVPDNKSGSWSSPASGTPQQVTGGLGFDDAVEISSGTYSTEAPAGKKMFFKTRIGYGQQGLFSLDSLELPQRVINNAKETNVAYVASDIYAPDFSQMNSSAVTATRFPFSEKTGVVQQKPEFRVVPEVRFRNRWDSPAMYFGESRGFSMDGYYYYVLEMGSTHSSLDGISAKINFSLNVSGDVSGQPRTTATASGGGTPSAEDSTKLGLLVAGSGLLLLGGGGVTYVLLRRRR